MGERTPGIDPVNRVFWVEVPRRAATVSSSLHRVATDTHQLVMFPIVVGLLVPAALVLGIVIGRQRWGYDVIVTESLVTVGVLVSVGFFSAYLGAALWVGFVAGDWLSAEALGDGSFADFRVPYLIVYFVLATAMIAIPLGVRTLLLTLSIPRSLPAVMAVPLALTGTGLLAYLFVDLWTAAVPLVARTVFFWQGWTPSTQAIFPLQIEGFKIARIAAVVAMARVLFVFLVERFDGASGRIRAVVEAAQPSNEQGVLDRTPAWVQSLIRVGLALALMASLYGSLGVLLALGVPLALVQLVRANVIPVPLDWWRRRIERAPMIIRVVAVVWGASQVIDRFASGGDLTDYPQLATLVVITSIVGVVLMPGPSRERLTATRTALQDADLYGRVDWLAGPIDGDGTSAVEWLPGDFAGSSRLAPDGSRVQ